MINWQNKIPVFNLKTYFWPQGQLIGYKANVFNGRSSQWWQYHPVILWHVFVFQCNDQYGDLRWICKTWTYLEKVDDNHKTFRVCIYTVASISQPVMWDYRGKRIFRLSNTRARALIGSVCVFDMSTWQVYIGNWPRTFQQGRNLGNASKMTGWRWSSWSKNFKYTFLPNLLTCLWHRGEGCQESVYVVEYWKGLVVG